MILVRDRTFGPLAQELLGMSVDVESRGPVLEVYYNRDLRARFDQASGELLPLDEVPQAEKVIDAARGDD